MKISSLLILIALVSCSSKKDTQGTEAPSGVTNESFKKEKVLKTAEIEDFYPVGVKSLNPALEDETLDRYTSGELEKLSDSTDPLLQLSLKCISGQYEEAFEAASKMFNRYQKLATYWNQIANCHLNNGAYRKALLFYNKALEVSPNYVPALNNIGVMYSRQGLHQKAQVAFERAFKQSKFSKTPRYNLARIYLTFGLADQALPLFQGLLNSSPSDIDLLNAVGSSQYLLGDYQKAMNSFAKIPQEEWSKAEIGLNIAMSYKKLGRDKDAQKIFLNVDKPKSDELKRYYASIGKLLGDNE